MTIKYIAVPKAANFTEDYLYSNAEVIGWVKNRYGKGIIIEVEAEEDSGFSAEILRDRMASGLAFGTVFEDIASAVEHLRTF